ncbi:hypothetical protein [Rugosimonospora africana]|uniref:hypothetical protein n=1 Tax=Rugosimonospora africana TaxID=556532 RepID=UPI0019413CAC|nr:hypothetical protein [Rugosimonospora africana]
MADRSGDPEAGISGRIVAVQDHPLSGIIGLGGIIRWVGSSAGRDRPLGGSGCR